ncbi:ATP-binding cassette domain-containing protein [Streptomyces paludis]|uniref:ATP-binding cassette domain-containing protein n=2 Tax=Streptomyces paludis TaxID=2282738 RepID=A0A345HWZ7_9ACTN|nr:ATP-binding cassette domain-containing protein [Streptomyces paludis]
MTGLVQGYGNRQVIRGMDLVLGVGVFGLLGPNGAGKTTLFRTLATVTPPRGGSLEICGEEVLSEASVRRARRNIGYLPQDFTFFPSYSVYDFVRYCAWLRDVPEREADGATRLALEKVDLADRAKARMKSLSGGMVRRAGIASAIVGAPRLLLLDEPTVGLDPAQRLEFRSLIRSLRDVAVVLSTHLVEDVAALCDDVAVLTDGGFVFRGTPADLAGRAAADSFGDSPLERGYMAVLGQAGRAAAV